MALLIQNGTPLLIRCSSAEPMLPIIGTRLFMLKKHGLIMP